MKIRTGFVSNSSSSSFIVGYGMLKDGETEESMNERLREYGAGCYVMGAEDLLEYAENWFPVVSAKYIPDGDWAFIYWYGNEGDHHFLSDEPVGYNGSYVDYSPASHIGYYEAKQQELINLLKRGELFDRDKPFDSKFGADYC